MEKSDKSHKDRRALITRLAWIVILSVVSLPLIGDFLIPKIKKHKLFLRIKENTVPSGGALIFRQKNIAVIKSLINNKKNIYALSLKCTHLGCTVNAGPKGFTCPCHGSRFDSKGNVVKGPASLPLTRFSVKKDDKDILIY